MTRSFDIQPFLGRTVPVELVAELLAVTRDGSSVRMHCATKHYDPQHYDYYGTDCETVLKEPGPGEEATVQLDFWSEEIVRLRYAPGGRVPDHDTPMVVGEPRPDVSLELTETGRAVTIETAALRVVVLREPWQLLLYDRAGALLWATRPLDLESLRRPEEQWHPEQQRWLFYHRYAYPLGCADYGDRRHVFLSSDLRYDEHIYGFGEDFGSLDKRQTRQQLWHVEAYGNASPGSYKHVPFFLSTRGVGTFINSSNAIDVRVGDLEHTATSVTVDDAELLDLFLIYGPELKEILPRYTSITGEPSVPPKWSFGLWMSRISYNSQEQVEAVARELRDHRIPCDVIHIDTDWFEHEWECDLSFSPDKFPNPRAMTTRLREQGFHVSVWQWPNMVVGSEMYEEGRDKGYLARRLNGEVYTFPGFEADAGFIDYSNPEAVAWVQDKIQQLFEQGVSVIKADFGEGAPPDVVYHSVPGESMHNLYPLLYNRAIFEVTEDFWGEGRGVIWARSAWAGSQRYPVHWSGDGIARYEDMPCVLRSALSFGLSGFPFYSHDIGGFIGLPSPELYVRWAQFGLFSSHARAHGEPPREPWAYGEEAERIFRRYAELRYRLLPYIYTEAVESVRASIPMLRALVLEYQDDPVTFTLGDQYLFGRYILVAPIFDETNRRRVYLPAGTWIDYWNKEKLEGGRWTEVEAPLDVLPLYVQGGAILPYGPTVHYVDEVARDPLTLEIYAPAEQASYTIHDEGQPDIAVSYRCDHERMKVDVGEAPGQVKMVLFGVDVEEAKVDGQRVASERLENGGVRISFDGRQPRTLEFELR